MTINSTDNDEGNSFEYRLREVSDEEIINILRYREHYQPHAVREAIREAMNRGIISSPEDLNKEEFSAQPLPVKSIFPVGISEKQNVTIFKSLCRIVYIFCAIPIIFSVVKFSQHSYLAAVSYLLLGVYMVFVAYNLERKRNVGYSTALLLSNFPIIGFSIYTLFTMEKIVGIDIFAAVTMMIIFVYTSFYLHKLALYFSKK